jgi:hypothetical protein
LIDDTVSATALSCSKVKDSLAEKPEQVLACGVQAPEGRAISLPR